MTSAHGMKSILSGVFIEKRATWYPRKYMTLQLRNSIAYHAFGVDKVQALVRYKIYKTAANIKVVIATKHSLYKNEY